MKPKTLVFQSLRTLAEALAKEIIELANKSFRSKTACYIMLSGGSTPKALFEVIAKSPPLGMSWEMVHFFWGDERCVAPDDLESNYGMAWQTLLQKLSIPASNIHRIRGEEIAEIEAKRYSAELKKVVPAKNEIPVFDLIMLGMGDDGHTASIFPDRIDIIDSENLCEATVNPYTGQQRITVTPKALNNAQKIVFMVTGKNKASVVSEILLQKGDYLSYPASYIKPTTGELVWMLDEDASRLLPR